MTWYSSRDARPVFKCREGRALVDRSSIGRVVKSTDGRHSMVTGWHGRYVELSGQFYDVDELDQGGIRFEDGSRLFEEEKK